MGMKFIGIEGNRDCYSPQQVSSCTVGEFIEYLSNYDEDMPLYLVNDNGYTYGSLGEYDISEHYINDDGDLDGEMDEEDLDECQLYTKESYSDVKYVGKTWKDFINDIESNSNYKVDSAYRRKYEQWIELIDDNGVIYDAEVTPIYRGGYELMDYNINKSYSHNESVRKVSKTRIKESAIKNNIENIMYNASLVHNYDDLDVVLSSLYKLDKELYNKYQDIYRTQKIRPKQLADMIYDELSDILGRND